MRVNAVLPIMILLLKGTPSCLKVEHVKVSILLILIYQVYRYFALRVRKRTIVSKLTLMIGV